MMKQDSAGHPYFDVKNIRVSYVLRGFQLGVCDPATHGRRCNFLSEIRNNFATQDAMGSGL
jgi:hypothetical protein